MAISIFDWNDLDAVRNDLTADYTLENDLDQNTTGYSSVASSSANSGNGFDIIGDSSNEFTGTFDGQNNTISDLTIDRSNTDYCGIISTLGNGTISNLNLDNIDVTGDVFCALLVGRNNDGSVTNCSANNSTINGGDWTGGLIGFHTSTGSIDLSYVLNSTINGGERTGGLVAEGNGTVDKSYTSNLDVDGSSKVGGLVGVQDSNNISNTYTINGNVNANDTYAGLIANNSGTVEKSYSNNTVQPGSFNDGLIGFNSGAVTDSYWDTQTSGLSSSDGGTGLTTSDMQGDSADQNMAFNFTNIWEEVKSSDSDTSSDGYPILQDLDRQTQLEAQGTFQASPDATLVAIDTINITENSADLEMDVQSINNTNDITVKAEFRKISDTSFTTISDSKTVSSTGTVTLDLPSLSTDQEYEWRGFAID